MCFKNVKLNAFGGTSPEMWCKFSKSSFAVQNGMSQEAKVPHRPAGKVGWVPAAGMSTQQFETPHCRALNFFLNSPLKCWLNYFTSCSTQPQRQLYIYIQCANPKVGENERYSRRNILIDLCVMWCRFFYSLYTI